MSYCNKLNRKSTGHSIPLAHTNCCKPYCVQILASHGKRVKKPFTIVVTGGQRFLPDIAAIMTAVTGSKQSQRPKSYC